jgi:hypothetical protein
MKAKETRHFFFGLLFGVVGMYWSALYAAETFDQVLAWLQHTADTYRAEHPTGEVDTGWRPHKIGDR